MAKRISIVPIVPIIGTDKILITLDDQDFNITRKITRLTPVVKFSKPKVEFSEGGLSHPV